MTLQDLIVTYPTTSIIAISFLVTLVATLVQKFFTDQNRIKEIKQRQKEMQAKMKEHSAKGEHDKMLQLQQEVLKDSMELFRHTLKPTLITLIPFLLIFWWIKNIYVTTTIASVWFWYYLVSALIFSIVLRKVLNVA